MVYSVLVKWPEQPIRQHLRLSFDELFTAMCRTLSNSDSLESYGSERLSYLLGWPSLYVSPYAKSKLHTLLLLYAKILSNNASNLPFYYSSIYTCALCA